MPGTNQNSSNQSSGPALHSFPSSKQANGSKNPDQSNYQKAMEHPRSNSAGRFHDSPRGTSGNRQDRDSSRDRDRDSDRGFDSYHGRSRRDDYSYNQYGGHMSRWEQDFGWNNGGNWNQGWYPNRTWTANSDQNFHGFDMDYSWQQSDGATFAMYNPNMPPPGWNGRGRGRGRGVITRGGWRGGANGPEWQQRGGYHSSDEPMNSTHRSQSPPTKDTPTISANVKDTKDKESPNKSKESDSGQSAGHTSNLSLKASQIIDDIMKGGTGKGVAKEPVNTSLKPKKSDTSGPSLMDKAENLCKELRMKRQLQQREKARKEKRARELEKKKWDEQLHREESLQRQSPNRAQKRSNSKDRTHLNYSKDSSKVSFAEEESSSKSPLSTPDVSLSRTVSQPKPSQSSSKSVSSIMKAPNTSRARRVSESGGGEKQDNQDSNIRKLINSPRSRRERMEVAKILTKYGKVIQQKHRPRLSFNSETIPDHEEVEGEILQLDELPDELKHEIAQLMQTEEIAEGSAIQIPEHPASEMSLYDIINQQMNPAKTSTPSETPLSSFSNLGSKHYEPQTQDIFSTHTPSVSSITVDPTSSRSRTVTMDTTPSELDTSSRFDAAMVITDLTSPERPTQTSKPTSSPIVIQDKDDDEPSTTGNEDSQEDDCMVVEEPRSPPHYPPEPEHHMPNAIVIQPEEPNYHYPPGQQYEQYINFHNQEPAYSSAASYHSPHLDYYASPMRTDSIDTDRSVLAVDDLDTSGGGEMDHGSQDSSGRKSPGNKRRRTTSATVSTDLVSWVFFFQI